MLKHAHRDFPSDVFNLLEASGASLFIRGTIGYNFLTPQEFLDFDMTHQVIQYVALPEMVPEDKFM